MRTLLRRTSAWAIAGLGVLLLAGCDEDGQSRNVVRIVSVNDNQPVFSDVIIVQDTTFSAADDVVEVTLASRVHDDILDIAPDTPYSSVHFTTYDVDYVTNDLDGDTVPDLNDFTGSMNITVPTGGEASGSIVILRISDKLRAPLICLGDAWVLDPACSGTMDVQYTVRANITVHGSEETSGDDIEATGQVTLQIANYADED
jgi:hypothetical protein